MQILFTINKDINLNEDEMGGRVVRIGEMRNIYTIF